MIHAYSWCTPNGEKLHIMLEETGIEYEMHPINIGKGEQFSDEFKKINPNSKIPAIVDTDGPDDEPLSLMESGAILFYLAEKTGRFLPTDPRGLNNVRQWMFFHTGHVSPMFGQAHHFEHYAKTKIPYAIRRYARESCRLMSVLDLRLSQALFVAGPQYTIADMHMFPWIKSGATDVKLSDYPHVERWFQAVSERPAIQRAMQLLHEKKSKELDDEARRHLFGEE
jgi:GST-like protein